MMKTTLRLWLIGTGLFVAASVHSAAQTNVTGIVVDEHGKPIARVACRVTGFPWPSGRGHTVYTGVPEDHFTGGNGHFAIPLPRSDLLIDLQFDHGAYAPVFLYAVNPTSAPLRVVMSPGKVLSGRVVDEQHAAIPNAEVELDMPQEGLWYQKKAYTDWNGEFHFRVSEPPKTRSWVLSYAGKGYVHMTMKAEPNGAANGSQPIRSETNRTSEAAGSRR